MQLKLEYTFNDLSRSNDWDPLLGTLRMNKNVKSISLLSSYIPPNENDPSGMNFFISAAVYV